MKKAPSTLNTGPVVDFAALQDAARRLAPYLLPTPYLRCPWLSERAGADVRIKWEALQHTGSFKLRGALNKMLRLRDEGVRDVLAVSAGNHGLGVARAATLLGMRATVVVPEGASPTKVAAIRREGADLYVRGASYDEAEALARALAATQHKAFVSPYNDPDVIAGQGTIALEILRADPGIEGLIVPVGGGGLIAGCGLAASGAERDTIVVGAQPENAAAMHAALAAGRIVPTPERPTCADGLAGGIEADSITFPLVQSLVREILLVSEERIQEAIRGFAEHDHLIVEGSGAVGAAAILGGVPPSLAGRRIAVIVTGRNIDRARLAAILAAP